MYIVQRGPHICGSQRSCQTHARSFCVSFQADDETECYLSFLIDSKNWSDQKAQLLWLLYKPPVAGTYSVLLEDGKCAWKLRNWCDKMEGKKRNSQHHFIPFLKYIYILCLKRVLEMTSSQLVLFIT